MLAIFDLDGTLLNTIADLASASNYALEQCGFPAHSPEAYPYFVGNGVKKLLERILPEDARTPDNAVRMMQFFREYYGEHLCDSTRPYDGIPRLLERLHEEGFGLAVASNKYQAAVETLISHFFPNVEWAAIEGQKEGVPVKPDPSIVFGILAKYPTPKSEVIYVGDSGVDMTTASRAGVTSIGVTWGFRPLRELRENYADNIANTPADVLSVALRLKKADGVE